MSKVKEEKMNLVESLYKDADKEKFFLTAEEEKELLEHPFLANSMLEDKLKIEW